MSAEGGIVHTTEKPIAYAFTGPDGLHFVNLKPAAAWLGCGYATLRATAAAQCLGIGRRTALAERLLAEFPALCRPAVVEVAV